MKRIYKAQLAYGSRSQPRLGCHQCNQSTFELAVRKRGKKKSRRVEANANENPERAESMNAFNAISHRVQASRKSQCFWLVRTIG